MPDGAPADAADEVVVVERRVERVARDVGDLGRQVGAARPRPTARRTSAGRRSAAPGPRPRPRARAAPAGAARPARRGGCTSSCPLMPRWPEQGVAVVEREPEVLAPPPGGLDAAAGQRLGEAGGPADVTAHRAGVQHVDAGDRGAEHVALEAGADDLDLGELGHVQRRSSGCRRGRRRPRPAVRRRRATRRSRRTPSRRRPARPPSWSGPRRCRRAASADAHLGGEGLHVVGAVVLDDVLGHAERVLGGELLQRGLPVEAGAQRGGRLDEGVEEQVHDLRRRSRCRRSRCTAPITASTVSERIEAFSRPPVASSPRPSLTCSPRPMRAATPASARALTTAARSLASRPSERSGWVR